MMMPRNALSTLARCATTSKRAAAMSTLTFSNPYASIVAKPSASSSSIKPSSIMTLATASAGLLVAAAAAKNAVSSPSEASWVWLRSTTAAYRKEDFGEEATRQSILQLVA